MQRDASPDVENYLSGSTLFLIGIRESTKNVILTGVTEQPYLERMSLLQRAGLVDPRASCVFAIENYPYPLLLEKEINQELSELPFNRSVFNGDVMFSIRHIDPLLVLDWLRFDGDLTMLVAHVVRDQRVTAKREGRWPEEFDERIIYHSRDGDGKAMQIKPFGGKRAA
jgi:hypothetical protein